MDMLKKMHTLLFVIFLCLNTSVSAQLFINELVASNDNGLSDEAGEFDDWIEIYNAGPSDINLAGYYFSENVADPTFWQIPATDLAITNVPAGGYLIIWADNNPEQGPHHIGFKLSANGESVFLTAPNGNTLIDGVDFPSVASNFSYGRITDGGDTFQSFSTPTPGSTNINGPATYRATLVKKINDGNDDAEEPFNQPFLTLNDDEINIVNDWSGDQTVGFRFDELNIPGGAIVHNAYIQFVNANLFSSTGPSNLTIAGHASGNSQPFESTAQNISSRPRTSNTVDWQPVDWIEIDIAGVKEQTPALTTVVKEMLEQSDWNTSSALTFIFTGTGSRVPYSFEGDPGKAATLYLEVSLPVSEDQVSNLYINEIAPSGTSHLDEFGNPEDWVEIFNAGTETVNLGGLYLSDNYTNLAKWQIGEPYLLAPQAFVVIFMDNDPEEGGLHADFSLEGSGERIALGQAINNEITIIDSVSFGVVPIQSSFGRTTDGASTFVRFGETTPGASNNGSMLSLDKPSISLANGIYQGTEMVSLSHPDVGVTIKYTQDGTDPTASSTAYSTPFTINDNTSLRARAFKNDHVPSQSAVGSYLFNITSNIPTLYINTDPANFFDDEIGIYVEGTNGVEGYCRTDAVNWNQDWERPINFGMFLPDGSEAFNVNAGIKIGGGCSRIYAQKSLNIYLRRNTYGDSDVGYPIFAGRDFDNYERLKLRNSGQDYLRTMMRDGFVQTLIWGKLDLDLQGFQPTTTYINGDFFGIYNIREIYTDEYFASNYGIKKEELDVIKNPKMPWQEVKNGNTLAYDALYDFVENNDLSIETNYQTVAAQVDINEFINYWTFSLYIAKFDWPANNIIVWRERKAGEKWRWAALDHDGSTDNGFHSETAPNYNTLEQVMVANSSEWPNHSSSTLFLRKLLKNDNFRNEFVQRSASISELVYAPERTDHILDSLRAMIEPHIPAHAEEYADELSIGGSVLDWGGWVDQMGDFFESRAGFQRGFINDQFDLNGTYELILNYNANTGGTVVVNSNEMETPFNFTNLYYKNISLKVKAIAKPNYVFSHWLETGETDASIDFVSNADVTLTPVFQLSISLGADREICLNDEVTINAEVPNCSSCQYAWSNGTNQSSIMVTPASTTTYVVTVTDPAGNPSTDDVIIQVNPSPIVNAAPTTIACGSGNSGSIDLTISGGMGTYDFAWSNGVTTEDIDNLGIGVYQVTVTDQNTGCSSIEQVAISSNSINAVPVATPVSCNGAADGSIDLMVDGGSGFNYTWSNGATTQDIGGLSGGVYGVTVTDGASCSTAAFVQVPEPSMIVVNVNTTAPSSAGASDGIIELQPTGGTPSFSYQWSTGAASSVLLNVPTGSYMVTVTDLSGCSQTETIDLIFVSTNEPENLLGYDVFPNPTAGQLNIQLNFREYTEAQISLYSFLGQRIWQYSANGTTISDRVNLAGQSTGMYLLVIATKDGQITEKVILTE